MEFERVIAVRNDKTVYRDGDACIKAFNEHYAKSDVLHEALNQARAEELGLKVPAVREVTVQDGKWMIISDYIKGTTLSDMMKREPEKKETFLRVLVDLQEKVLNQNSLLLSHMSSRLRRQIAMSDIDAVTRYDLVSRLDKMPRHAHICHGDFVPSNIMVTEAGEMYILDWSKATQGNATADAASTYLMLLLQEDEEAAEMYLNIFCERHECEIKAVKKWLPIVAAARVSKNIPHERETLMKWVRVVDPE